MSLTAAALRLLAEKGLTAADIVELAEVLEVRRDPTAAERMRRYRAKKADTVTVTRNVTSVTPDGPPNDIYSNPPGNPVETNVSTPPFAEKVVSEWNDGPAKRGARKAQKLDAARRKQLAARVKEHGEAAVFVAIRGMATSAWHCGDNDRKWRASLGWMLESPKRFLDAIERADDEQPNAVKPVTDTKAYLDGIGEKPWMRGRENELAPRNGTGPPRSFGQLAAGIASETMVQ